MYVLLGENKEIINNFSFPVSRQIPLILSHLISLLSHLLFVCSTSIKCWYMYTYVTIDDVFKSSINSTKQKRRKIIYEERRCILLELRKSYQEMQSAPRINKIKVKWYASKPKET